MPTREELTQLVRMVREDGYHHPHTEVHIHLALQLLEELIVKGEETHEPMDWKALGIRGNLERAEIHCWGVDWTTGENVIDSNSDKDNLLHQACRLLMALQLREEARNAGR